MPEAASLRHADWQRVTVHDMHAAFLRGEREKYMQALASAGVDVALIDAPDLRDPEENRQRMRLVYGVRRWLVGEIPPDTEWYEVRSLTADHAHELRVIGRCGWDSPLDRNQLAVVADRLRPVPVPPTAPLDGIVLWGHDPAGPFTILEGNHRLTACAAHATPFEVAACVGLSPSSCYWHLDDPARMLLNDFWRD
jgi:hypothetical protein